MTAAAHIASVDAPSRIALMPDEPAVAAATDALRMGVAALKFYEPAALLGEVEPVHQYRVTLRRLRAAVELMAGLLHGSRLRYYRLELPLLGHSAGAVRDCDALGELVRRNAARLDPGIARALVPAYQTLSDQRVAALRRFNRTLHSPGYAKLIERLNSPLLRRIPAEEILAQRVPAMVRPIIGGALRVGARLTAVSSPAAFHRLRIRLKRVRYTFEMLEAVSGKQTLRALKRLKRMQEILGEQQDLVTTAEWMRQFARQPTLSGDTLLAAGAMLQLTTERREEVAAEAFRCWQKFQHSGVLSKAQKEIAEKTGAHCQAVYEGKGAA